MVVPDWSDLESPVCDLVYMIELATAYAERVVSSSHKHQVKLEKPDTDLIMFGLYAIGRMARDLKEELSKRQEVG